PCSRLTPDQRPASPTNLVATLLRPPSRQYLQFFRGLLGLGPELLGGHRSTFFRLARAIRLNSTTQDTSILDALDLVLANEDRTTDLLPIDIDLSFASEQWKRTILVRTAGCLRLARRHFEVCVFAALAAALRSGDVAVEGSNAFADYREQLLTWA